MITLTISHNGQKRSIETRGLEVKDGRYHFYVTAVHDTRTGRELDNWLARLTEEHWQRKLFQAYIKQIRGL